MRINNKINSFKMLRITASLLILCTFQNLIVKADSVDSSNSDLISITINGQKLNITYPWIINYSIDLPSNTSGDYLVVETEVYNKNSTVSIEGNRIVNNSALVKITVTAENRISTRTYYINVELKDAEENGGFTSIRTSDFHTLALKNDGTLYGFGANNFGQLGDDTKTFRTSPAQVDKLTGVIDFDASNSHSITVTSDGNVWVWGLNDFGQLNSNSNKDILVPYRVESLHDIVKVRAGNRFSLALDKYGRVWFWGYNSKEQFEENIYLSKPAVVEGFLGAKVVDIAAGDYHCLALSDDGKIYSWGANDFGQLGDGTQYNKHYPIVIEGLKKVNFISANGNTSSCVTEYGEAYYWGEVIFHKEEMDESIAVLKPEPIKESNEEINDESNESSNQKITEVQSIEVNNNHIVYIKKDGSVYSMGINKYGQLGNGTTYNRSSFSQIYGLSCINNVAISQNSTFFIDENGYIYASGRNNLGQLGLNQVGGNYSAPRKLQDVSSSNVSNVYSNYESGEVDKGIVIRLGTDTLNAKIYYTLDGNDPTDKSILFGVPIVINEYTKIKAIALKDGKYSGISTFEYLISNKSRTEMNITIGNKEGKIGDYIEIPIKFSNIPSLGISNLKFAVKFNPEILSFQSAAYGEIINNNSDFGYKRQANDTILFDFYDNSRTNRNITKSGTFATMKFYIKSNSSIGRYSIAQIYNGVEGVFSKGNRRVNVYYNAGYVDVVNPNSITLGDVDGDRKVTALDLQYIQRYVFEKIRYFPHYKGMEAADADEDGDVDSNDVELVKKIILNSH